MSSQGVDKKMEFQGNLSQILYSNQLDITKFERLISNNAQGYKFYWLEAIMQIMKTGEREISFDDIINEMIWEAWRTVTHFHLRLGPTVNGNAENFLEHAIRILNSCAQKEIANKLPAREKIIKLIKKYDDQLLPDKVHLTDYVPYRLIKPFVDKEGKGLIDRKNYSRFIAYLNSFSRVDNEVFYNIIDSENVLSKKVVINPEWANFMMDNFAVIMGWLQYNKAKYIQDRNPGVPGVMYKISPESDDVRKLNEARVLWKMTVNITGKPLYEIYTGDELNVDKFELDHFIPRSYISNDELWDLIPASKSINASKNNKLPQWDRFFNQFAEYQYYLYSLLFSTQNEALIEQYKKCERYNVNAVWATEKLYVPGNSEISFKNILEENMEVVYASAKLQEYEMWEI